MAERKTSEARTRQRKNPEEMIQYLVSSSSGEDFVIEIPAFWKITFGRVNPALEGEGHFNRANGHCLRVWEGEKLRAVFGNVTGVRDLTIPLARKVIKTESEQTYKSDSLGNFQASSSRKLLDEGFIVEEDSDPF